MFDWHLRKPSEKYKKKSTNKNYDILFKSKVYIYITEKQKRKLAVATKLLY